MANASILAAFERFWQHTVAALGNKADASHTHDEATQTAAGLLSAEDKTQLDYGGIPIVAAASTDGATYTATVDGMTALTVGMKVTIIPDIASTTTTPKLNVNSLGAKTVRMPIALNTSLTTTGPTEGWLVAGKPMTVQYNGTYWITVDMTRAAAQYLYGTVPVSGGGTGATTADAALTNLGAAKKSVFTTAVIGTTWTGDAAPYTQTISISGVTADNVVEISLPSTTTSEEVAAYQALNLQDGGQTTDTITLQAFGTVNTVDININVVIRGDL